MATIINRKQIIRDAVEVFKEQNEGEKTSIVEVTKFVDAFEEAVFRAVEGLEKDGDKYPTVKTGVFSITKADKKATTARNPKLNTEVQVPAKTVVKIKPSSELKKLDKVNE